MDLEKRNQDETMDDLFYQANYFLEKISGIDELGVPKAKLLIRIGGGETSSAIESTLGPVILSKKNMQGCYMIDFTFESKLALTQCNKLFNEYAKYVDVVNGAVDDNHMLSVIIMDNTSNADSYLIGQIPVFFAMTSESGDFTVDTFRVAFRKDCLFYFNAEALLSDENINIQNDQEDSDKDEPSWFTF